jgi:LPXTG-motif cell wall-anchored protein
MYTNVSGKGAVVATTAGTVAVLPATGNNNLLYITAAVLLVVGLVTLAVTKLVASKAN